MFDVVSCGQQLVYYILVDSLFISSFSLKVVTEIKFRSLSVVNYKIVQNKPEQQHRKGPILFTLSTCFELTVCLRLVLLL